MRCNRQAPSSCVHLTKETKNRPIYAVSTSFLCLSLSLSSPVRVCFFLLFLSPQQLHKRHSWSFFPASELRFISSWCRFDTTSLSPSLSLSLSRSLCLSLSLGSPPVWARVYICVCVCVCVCVSHFALHVRPSPNTPQEDGFSTFIIAQSCFTHCPTTCPLPPAWRQ